MKILKRIGIFLLFFILLLAGALATLFVLTDPNKLVQLLSDQLQAKTGRVLSAEEVRLNPLKGIELEKVKLSRKGGFGKGTALDFDTASFVYQPLSIFFGRFDILNIRIDDLYTTSKQLQAIIHDFSKPKNASKSGSKKRNLIKVQVRQIEILNSQILYQDIPVNLKLQLQPAKDINQSRIRLTASSLYGDFSFDGTPSGGELKAWKIRLKKIIPKAPDILLTEINAGIKKQDDQTYAATGKTAVVTWNNLLFRSSSQFDISYNLKSQSLLLRNLDLNINKNHLTLDRLYYSIPSQSLELQIPRSQIQLSDFVPHLTGKLSGQLNLTYRKKLHLEGDLSISNLIWKGITNGTVSMLALDPLLQGNFDLDTLGGNLNGSLSSADLGSKSLKLSLSSKSLNMPLIIHSLAKEKTVQVSQSLSNQGISTNQKSFGFFLPVRLRFSGQIDSLIIGKTRLTDFKIDGKGYQDLLEIPDCHFNWIRGKAQASIEVQHNIARGSIKFQNGKLKDFTRDFLKSPRKLYGTLGASSKFSFPLLDFSKLILELKLNIQNGELKEFIFQNKLSHTLYDIPLNDVFFRSITSRFTLNQGEAWIQNLKFQSDSIQINGGADLNLGWLRQKPIIWKKTLSQSSFNSLHAEFAIQKEFISSLPNLTQLLTAGFSDGNLLRINIKGKGPLTKPSIQILSP